MLLVTYDSETAPRPDPEALIEEARQRQRRRTRRQRIVLASAATLAILGFGIDQLAEGGGGVHATPMAAAVPSTTSPKVTYEKIVVLKIVPHLPVEKRTIETWSASGAPTRFRQVVAIAGGPRLEIGTTPGSGKVLGPELVNFLYDRSSNTIFRTGFMLAPAQPQPTTPEQAFKRALAEPGTRLAGTRTYRGQAVYVIAIHDEDLKGTVYVDKRTYEPMMSDMRSTDLRNVVRTLAFKTLPATKANLALTNLQTAHPHARLVLHASLHIRALFGMAAFPSGQYGSA